MGGTMTKLEFAIKLEEYEKRQRQDKWMYFGLAFVLFIFALVPSVILYFDAHMFGFSSTSFIILGVLSFSKARSIQKGTEEHELLINAIGLLSVKNET
ncbi:MAG: apolipoprotein N-acyltransferase [Candidatus Azotimanducaceae bacterium]|jgi:hypothetical protein